MAAVISLRLLWPSLLSYTDYMECVLVNKEHGTHLTVDGILSLDGISFSTLHSGSTTTGSQPLEQPKLES
jgi:hypothetical protein